MAAQDRGNRRTVLRLIGVAALMGALAWASVPGYGVFTRVTGYGGATDIGDAGTGPREILDRTIRIRFDVTRGVTRGRGMPWQLQPAERQTEVRIGETATAYYEAFNPTDRTIAASVKYNVTPFQAGGFFTKTGCFCFETQILGPGERARLPVSFYVDPAIVTDRDAKFVHTITLSYTFYEIDLPQARAALAQDSEIETN